nr:VOC family protein [Fictibacillus sp. 26RED30]
MKKNIGKVVGFELSSQEPEKAVTFYRNVFGWQIAEPQWDYWAATTTEGENKSVNGGIAKGPQDFPHGTRIQIEVEVIDDAIEHAVLNGATIVREKMEFEEFYLAYLNDPTGIGFGLIQNKK